jgi:hypothetical protein
MTSWVFLFRFEEISAFKTRAKARKIFDARTRDSNQTRAIEQVESSLGLFWEILLTQVSLVIKYDSENFVQKLLSFYFEVLWKLRNSTRNIIRIKVVYRLRLSLGSIGLGSGSMVSSLGSGLDSASVYRAWRACNKISSEYSVIQYLLPFSMLKVTFGHFE